MTIILGRSITILLHLLIYKHKSVPSTTLLALHRLHLLLLPAPTYDQRTATGRSNKSWKKQLKFRILYRDRSQPQSTSVPAPVPPSTTAEDNAPAYNCPDLTPVKFRRMDTFTARKYFIMAAAQHVPAKIILDSGAGISGVGELWKLTDISRMSSMSIQGAFGDSMRPSLQGLLGREKLPAVLVPGMKDDIYSLSGLLNSNGSTGAKDKVAIFTKNGAIILTADSCKEAILSAIGDGEKTHTADQVDGIYVLRQDLSIPPSSHLCAIQSHQIPLPSTEHLRLNTRSGRLYISLSHPTNALAVSLELLVPSKVTLSDTPTLSSYSHATR